MEIKNTLSIINDFIERDNFQIVYRDKNFPMNVDAGITDMSSGEALSFLLSASLTGNKSIGFFSSIQYVSHRYFLRGECLLITTELPSAISIPTIFCRNIDLFPDKLSAALKISFETKLPVMIVLSDNIVNNYTENKIIESDTDRVTPYLSRSTLKQFYSTDDLMEQYQLAEMLLSKLFENQEQAVDRLAFCDPDLPYFDYVVPSVRNNMIDALSQQAFVAVPEAELDLIAYIKKHYDLSFAIQTFAGCESVDLKREICPGCPFVSIFQHMEPKEKIVVTDVPCSVVQETYDMHFGAPSEVAGYACNMKDGSLLYVGNASNFHPKYVKYLERMEVVVLNDMGTCQVNLPKVAKPARMKSSSCVFPYSCDNVVKYGAMTVKPRKCLCSTNGVAPICMEKTYCTALVSVGELVEIDADKCTACGACKVVCPHGAIR